MPNTKEFSAGLTIVAFSLLVGWMLTGQGCAGSPPPDPKPALDLGSAIAVELCKREAPRQGFDPALCVAGGKFLEPYLEQAGREVFSALADRGPVAASVPCGGFTDQPAPPVPGNAVRSVGGSGG